MTNATNRDKWVDYVINIISNIVTIDKSSKRPLFDILLPRDSTKRLQVSKYSHRYYGGQQPKFLSDVYSALKCPLKEPIVMYDDKQGHIVPASGVRNYITTVPEYHFYEKDKHSKNKTFMDFFEPLIQAWIYENHL